MGHIKDLRQWRQAGQRLRRERERGGLSVRECAARLGVRADELLNIEAGNIYAFFRDEPRAERIVAEYEQLLTTVLSCVRPATPHHAESFIPVATSTPTPDVPRYLKTAG